MPLNRHVWLSGFDLRTEKSSIPDAGLQQAWPQQDHLLIVDSW